MKQDCLSGGDANSAYFHAYLKKRISYNHEYRLKNMHGIWRETQEDLEGVFFCSFIKDC